MEFFKKETKIDFMGVRLYTGIITALLWIACVLFLIMKGLNLGLDFTGGIQIEARFPHSVATGVIREQIESEGFHGVRVQQYGSTQDILIRVANPPSKTIATENQTSTNKASATPIGANASDSSQIDTHENIQINKVKAILKAKNPEVEIRRTEFVGSEVGEQLMEQGGLAVMVAILATMIYIALRFEYRLAVSAAVGLCHDGVLILGIFALFGFEFDLAALASVMAVLGYSLNDTIVVFDRVRENFRKVRNKTPAEVMNLSINQTLSRTIMTSWMTMLVVLALLFFGGVSLFGFSMAFFLGIIIGTFSSIYVSGALALWLGLSRKDLLPKVSVADERP